MGTGWDVTQNASVINRDKDGEGWISQIWEEKNNGGTNDCAVTLSIVHSNANGIQVDSACDLLSVDIHTQNANIVRSRIK